MEVDFGQDDPIVVREDESENTNKKRKRIPSDKDDKAEAKMAKTNSPDKGAR